MWNQWGAIFMDIKYFNTGNRYLEAPLLLLGRVLVLHRATWFCYWHFLGAHLPGLAALLTKVFQYDTRRALGQLCPGIAFLHNSLLILLSHTPSLYVNAFPQPMVGSRPAAQPNRS